jgi:hypothetical protein
MREWRLNPGDPMAPRIAADARAGRTNYTDDQVWQLRLGAPSEPAVSLETRYGGRVGLARVVPIWSVGRRQVYEAQGYHSPPVLTAFAPDYLRLRAQLTLALDLTYEFWTMESQAVGGRFTVHNTGDQPQPAQLDLSAQAARENQTLQMFFLTLDNGQVALQVGRLQHLQPVLLLEGATASTTTSGRLSRALMLQPGEQAAIRWVLAGLPDRDASLALAYKWLAQPNWDADIAEIEARSNAQPQIETGHPDWDAALAWSQQLVLRTFLASTGSLPHPSFVASRRTNQGYPAGGTYSAGFNSPWGGQSIPEALVVVPAAALAAPDLAKGVVRNFLAVQRDDGWIDARPGLDGQRVNMLAPPLLATLAYSVYHFTRDKEFLAECLPGLVRFLNRWFKLDVDRDGDGVPEWSAAGQGAFGDSPTLAAGQRWAQGVEIATVEAPDLLAYLIREARTILGICKVLEQDDAAREVRPRLDALKAALDELWDDQTGAFRYRDRDSHASPTGEIVFAGRGDEALSEHTALPQPSRLILHAIGGMGRKPSVSCTIEGVNAGGQPANETLTGEAFDWYRSMGSATTTTVWREIKYLKFGGLSRVFKVEVKAVDLSRHDQSLFMPLWSGALEDDRAQRLVAILTDPARYWRAYGVCACPANDPAYNADHQNGCGGMWPAWNARIGWALVERGYTREAADLFKRVLAAQVGSLKEEHTFRSLYNADTGAGLGDAGLVESVTSLGWFARLFGAFVLDAGSVAISDPLAFEGENMTWTHHGVRIQRSADGTAITFPSGRTVTLPPDAEPQVVRDG